MNNSSSCSANFTILSSAVLQPDHIFTLASNNCSLILPSSKSLTNKVNQISTATDNNCLHRILYAPVLNSSPCSKYTASKRIENLCDNWIPLDSNSVIILDSTVLSLFTFNFVRPYSYLLHFRHGSHDYSFEYIEFIIKRFMNSGYSFVSLIKLKNINDIVEIIHQRRDICIYLYDEQFLKHSDLIAKQKKMGLFLINCVNN